jgi:GTP-binding protein
MPESSGTPSIATGIKQVVQPLVAIVGRPNVGKSTLFNRLVGGRVAVVEDMPGTTRDRIYGEIEWRGRGMAVVDTAGIAWRDPVPVAAEAEVQARLAAAEADLSLVVVDAMTGPTELDMRVAREVQRSGRPYLLVVNKTDTPQQQDRVSEFYSLGLGQPVGVSAMHGTATGDLLDSIQSRLPQVEYRAETDLRPRLAIVGRPNVGKSSLVNAMLGEARSLVHDAPGTTRDSVDTLLTWEGEEVWIVDTAGIRRRGHIEPGVEQHSVLRAMRSIQRADVGIVVVDAFEGPTAQDAHIAGFVLDAGKGIVILANKWDLIVGKEFSDQADHHLRRVLHFLPESPLAKISALTGRHIGHVVPMALEVHRARNLRVLTSRLNVFLRSWIGRRDPPSRRGRVARFKYATQSGVAPPEFTLFFSNPEHIHISYRRYLENGLREEYGFNGTPVRVKFRAS